MNIPIKGRYRDQKCKVTSEKTNKNYQKKMKKRKSSMGYALASCTWVFYICSNQAHTKTKACLNF